MFTGGYIFISLSHYSLWAAHTLRSTGKPTKSPTPLPTQQPTWNPTREPTIAPAVDAITSDVTEIANSTIETIQSDEIKEQENSAGADVSSLSKNESGAAMKLSLIASKWHSALFGSLLLLL